MAEYQQIANPLPESLGENMHATEAFSIGSVSERLLCDAISVQKGAHSHVSNESGLAI
jgi:hypothetical protein